MQEQYSAIRLHQHAMLNKEKKVMQQRRIEIQLKPGFTAHNQSQSREFIFIFPLMFPVKAATPHPTSTMRGAKTTRKTFIRLFCSLNQTCDVDY